jgi:hypothetical protein
MDPKLIDLIAAFTLNIVNEFKHRNDVLTVDQIKARWTDHYNQFMLKNQALQNETKP